MSFQVDFKFNTLFPNHNINFERNFLNTLLINANYGSIEYISLRYVHLYWKKFHIIFLVIINKVMLEIFSQKGQVVEDKVKKKLFLFWIWIILYSWEYLFTHWLSEKKNHNQGVDHHTQLFDIHMKTLIRNLLILITWCFYSEFGRITLKGTGCVEIS